MRLRGVANTVQVEDLSKTQIWPFSHKSESFVLVCLEADGLAEKTASAYDGDLTVCGSAQAWSR